MPWQDGLLLFGAAVLGGAVNAVAGGGTLLTFPALLWAGQLEIVANATSTVALWPGALSSFWAYRAELQSNWRELVVLAVPSLLGGIFGATLLMGTSNATFAALVPYLILMATLLFVAQQPLARWQQRRAAGYPLAGAASQQFTGGVRGQGSGVRVRSLGFGDEGPMPRTAGVRNHDHSPTAARWLAVLAFQFLVGIYGGYFGAGIGILMLAAFGYLGLTNIHHMNALKNLNAMCINGIAAALFITRGLVDWRLALLMAAGSIVGGYAGAGTARRVGEKRVRRMIIFIGFALSLWLLWRK